MKYGLNSKKILVTNSVLRLIGNVVKTLSYPFHFLFPRKRFTLPEFSPARKENLNYQISPTIWQTNNYTNKVTLPIYCTYLINRFFSPSFNYRYMGTEEREKYIKQNAPQRFYEAYIRLNDGAAQADFWRLFVLYNEGGVYIDIDGHLVWKLEEIIKPNDSEVLIKRRDSYTNFFIASKKGNSFLLDTLILIVENIEQGRTENGVFCLTGPVTLNNALKDKVVNCRKDKLTCVQGTFSNEYFQYMDKKKGKWIHKKSEDLLK
ncbi:glycosyltransferase family 32 protein [Avibacterium paragallinarum]|uniref:glycosyltransferase family 32 protein n=1 Tax=Avibacterium paragallinarum TaxID=728 RepID=UPI00102A78BB|nr:glycosyltransferase [Avibacterium paragallinarum]RZN76346.1 glycosyl transferase [Avibacterium paragallinarum]